MIEKVESLVMAEEILQEVLGTINQDELNCQIECYENGKEQGFNIFGISGDVVKSIMFAKDRGSNDIVVYIGNQEDYISKYNKCLYSRESVIKVIVSFLRESFSI